MAIIKHNGKIYDIPQDVLEKYEVKSDSADAIQSQYDAADSPGGTEDIMCW